MINNGSSNTSHGSCCCVLLFIFLFRSSAKMEFFIKVFFVQDPFLSFIIFFSLLKKRLKSKCFHFSLCFGNIGFHKLLHLVEVFHVLVIHQVGRIV